MSLKFIDALFEKARKKDRITFEQLEKNKVRAAIEKLCEDNLHDVADELEFEALPTAIDNTLLVLEEGTITSKYEFEQLSETTFKVKLRDVGRLF